LAAERYDSRLNDARPVKVAAGAFGENLPARDLWLSPGHAVCVTVMDEVFIPVYELTNGATIAPVAVEEITYWHVELESHDVLLSERLATESYINTGNRAWFEQASGHLVAIDPPRTHADFARPFVNSDPVIEAVSQRLVARAEGLGWTRTTDMDMHLLVDGTRVEADIDGDLARFIFPARARDVRLRSRTFVPAVLPGRVDRRILGLRITGLSLNDGLRVAREVPLEHPSLSGFYPGEASDGTVWHWAAGELGLAPQLWEDFRSHIILRITFTPNPWSWVVPQRVEAETNSSSNVVPIRAV
jgi:Hint domain